NDDSARGTFVLIGTKVTKKALLQNNIFSGTGAITNQVGAVEKTNYRSVAPGFVNRAALDLRPTANALVVNAGSAPPTVNGMSLKPAYVYQRSASAATRPVVKTIDVGAYESAL